MCICSKQLHGLSVLSLLLYLVELPITLLIFRPAQTQQTYVINYDISYENDNTDRVNFMHSIGSQPFTGG